MTGLGKYLRTVVKHWAALLIGVGGAGLTWWGALGGPVPTWLGIPTVVPMLATAQFLARRDEFRRAERPTKELEAAGEPRVRAITPPLGESVAGLLTEARLAMPPIS